MATDINGAVAYARDLPAHSAEHAAMGSAPSNYSILTKSLKSQSDAVFVMIGDSTANATTEWFYLFLQALAEKVGAATRISYRLFDDTVGVYGAKTVIQAGSGEPSISVGADLRGWGADLASVGSEGADLDLRVECALTAYTGVSEQVLMSRFGNAGARSYRMYLNSAGTLALEWSADGTNLIASSSTVVVGVANGTRKHFRVTLDGDNGAAGNDVKFYLSDDGATWTQLGTTVTKAGVTSVFTAATQTIEVGSRNAAASASTGGAVAGAVGTFYGAYNSTTHDGPNRLPAAIRHLNDFFGMTGQRAGGPAISVFNGSIPGTAMAYTGDATRAPKIIPVSQSAFVWLNSSHNEGSTFTPATFKADLATLEGRVTARIGHPIISICNQNPQYSPRTVQQIAAQELRAGLIASIARGKQWSLLDTFAAFGTDSALVDTDGVHPLAAGSAISAAEAAKAFGS